MLYIFIYGNDFNIIELEFTPELFIIVLLTVQLIHDSALYEFVIKPYPQGHNQIIDVYKTYADENGYKILLVDSAMVLYVLMRFLFLGMTVTYPCNTHIAVCAILFLWVSLH